MDPRLDEAVRCARSGDPRAFRTLTEDIGPDLVRFLTSFLGGDAHAAHDVAQETFLRAWNALAGIQDADHLRRWCFRVGRCKAVSWLRRERPRKRRTASLEAGLGSGLRLCDREAGPAARADGELLDALRKALRRLPVRYAGAVHLHYVHGFSTRETARLLGVPRTTVKMRLFRARRFLAREIRVEAASGRPARDQREEPPRSPP